LSEIDISEAQEMLEPYPLDELEAYPVSTLVNSPRNNSVEVTKPR
jgi:putative SOS response-associated peptidase YedK